jgi:hypothetical protein
MEPTVLLGAVAATYVVMCGVLLAMDMVAAADAAAGAPGRGAPGRKRAARDPMKVWSHSTYWRFLKTKDIRDPSHREGKKFRARFRTPYPVFVEIVQIVEGSDFWREFHGTGKDASGRLGAPAELFVAASLRHLGTGTSRPPLFVNTIRL